MVQTMAKPVSATELDEATIQERINLLKRLRKMLELQREKFRAYLEVLDRQEDSINTGNTEALEQQAVMEQQVIREILAVQKVIAPLDEMYVKAYPKRKQEITNLQNSLTSLQEQVLLHNKRNRELLSTRRDELKKKIDALRIPKGNKSIYAGKGTGGMIDISC